jgi:hypothetical protein
MDYLTQFIILVSEVFEIIGGTSSSKAGFGYVGWTLLMNKLHAVATS